MTLINDGRKATQGVNEMFLAMRARRQSPTFKGEVQHFQNGYFFGHYNSRGGMSLILGPTSVMHAQIGYNVSCGWDWDSDAANTDFQEGGDLEVVVVGGKLPEDDAEILWGYAEDDQSFVAYRLQSRWYSEFEKKWYDWQDLNVCVLAQLTGDPCDDDDPEEYFTKLAPELDKAPETALETEYRLVYWSVGEDAFGLVTTHVTSKQILDGLKLHLNEEEK